MIINRAVTISALVGGALALLTGIASGNPILVALSSFLFLTSIGFWKYGYLLVPAITKLANIIEIHDGYEIAPTRDYIIKKVGNGYYATKFLEIKFYESSMDKGSEEHRMMFQAFEKAISSLKYIVKISLLVSVVDLSKNIDEVKSKRSSAEAKKAKVSDQGDIIKLDREIAMYNRYLDRVSHGERPIELVSFASTTAFGLTKEEAVSKVNRQAKELKIILSSSLACDIRELMDLEMINCFRWDTFFPATQEQLKDEVF